MADFKEKRLVLEGVEVIVRYPARARVQVIAKLSDNAIIELACDQRTASFFLLSLEIEADSSVRVQPKQGGFSLPNLCPYGDVQVRISGDWPEMPEEMPTKGAGEEA